MSSDNDSYECCKQFSLDKVAQNLSAWLDAIRGWDGNFKTRRRHKLGKASGVKLVAKVTSVCCGDPLGSKGAAESTYSLWSLIYFEFNQVATSGSAGFLHFLKGIGKQTKEVFTQKSSLTMDMLHINHAVFVLFSAFFTTVCWI